MKNADGLVRVGGVGTGRIFHYGHMRCYLPLFEKARLVGFFDLDRERAEWAMDEHRKELKREKNDTFRSDFF